MLNLRVDLRDTSEDNVELIGEALLNNIIVVVNNQNLTPLEEENFCKAIGECQYVKGDRSKHIAISDHILRVTGEKNEHGEEGLFGHTSALDWHANQASNPDRSPLIWLYADKGSRGSKTSWINMHIAYEDLPVETKRDLEDIEITLGYKKGSYSNSEFFVEHHAVDKPFKLVHTNDAGLKGLYFPFLQIFGMVGKTQEEFEDIMAMLKDHVLQDYFRYDHHWEDGDVVISEQWLSIHKRWEFDNMAERVLHRIAFDYSKVDYA